MSDEELLLELERLCALASPTPWKACKDGECQCGHIWSEPIDQCLVTVHDRWGDAPDMIYGEVGREQQSANVKLLTLCGTHRNRLLQLARRGVSSAESSPLDPSKNTTEAQ